ncbi:hypothetical protein AWL63_23830 (plasmid) [Sphingomonas panacis]|uniref:Enoyl reductase (ER) domain-containing protein n=1 Tax=Sphingomonas panacis TaxID=1560345 RepID=A0A1B3ZIE3_9SPHN|nr:alcohol dehydrogenase catalytic domain-containing protein [Sphingomonas panacis]AOH87196.1 hypothetical protein AWL63_23830 [Sphingomonas panacis]
MKAIVYHGVGDVRFESVPDPVLPSSKGAIVHITTCGICGSDLHPYHVNPGLGSFCIGHEAVGTVAAVGSDVRNFKVGDRVLVAASAGCGECARCERGEVILCERSTIGRAFGQGLPDLSGCQAEGVAVPAADRNLWPLPEEFSDDVGIMLTDNLSTAWYCARGAKVKPGDTVAVIGLGSVGLSCVMAAKAMGAARVFAIDLLADRRAAAAALGAEPIDVEDVRAAVLEMTDGAGVDAALDASGGRITTPLAVSLARRGGSVSVVGVTEQPAFEFPVLECLRKNLTFVTGVCSVQAQLPEIVSALKSGKLSADHMESLVTHRIPLSEARDAYKVFDERPEGLKKILLTPSG